MEVILLQDIKDLGKEHDIIKVRDGYGRNWLIPQGMAMVATESARKDLDERKKQEDRREEKLLMQINLVVDVLKQTTFRIPVKAGTSGKIFGRVTPIQVSEAIKKAKNLTVDRRKIVMPEEEISQVGTYSITANLHKDVSVNITIDVVAE